jgi:hypothetical protein
MARGLKSTRAASERLGVNATGEQLLESGGLRVRFFRRDDRYAHEIAVQADGRWRVALASVEGSALEDWPASGPFQSLHVERRDDSAVALLVGMAGKSHWSASCQIDAVERCVTFDVACRVRTAEAGFLGSTYRASGDAGAGVTVEAVGELGPAVVERAGAIVRLAVAPGVDCEARTIRWGYRVRADRG